MNVGYESIYPPPTYPSGITTSILTGNSWTAGGPVEKFKNELRGRLFDLQIGRCCYCRRALTEPIATHLEHFIDHKKFSDYRFEIRNLALSCSICNIKKAGYFKTWDKRYRGITKTAPITRTPVVKIQVVPGAAYPTIPADFRWVNPYVHKYSDHIKLERGWVFTGISKEGRRTIRGLRMNLLIEVERRAMETRFAMRGGPLSTLVGAFAELNQHRARDVANAVAKVIRRRRKSMVSP